MSKGLKYLLLLLVLMLGSGIKAGAEDISDNSRVLILYQERSAFADQRDTVEVLEEQLGHFKVDVTELPISEIDGVDFSTFDTVMVIALDQEIIQPSLIHTLKNFSGSIVWLGSSIENFLKEGNYPLSYEGENYQFVEVSHYDNKTASRHTYPIGQKRLFYEVKSQSQENKTFAWLSDGKNEAPFIITSKNLTYVSRVDMNEPLFYIFAAYLSELFQEKPLPLNQLMVSIQDVHGFSDQAQLRAMADKLYSLGIPFNVQVIPYFKLNGSKKIYQYRDVPQFTETLQYMTSKGGTILVESVPVTLSDNTISALDLSELTDKKDYSIIHYLNDAFYSLAQDNLKPMGFSSPHKYLSPLELKAIKAHLNTFVGVRYIAEGQMVVYPYVLEDTIGFERFYPLNLGYIDYTQPNYWDQLDETLTKLSMVNSPFYGLYFTPETPLTALDNLSQFAKKHDLRFYSLEKEHVRVDFSNVSYDSKVSLTYQYLTAKEARTPLDKVIQWTSTGVFFILCIGITLFGLIYWRSLKKTSNLSRKE